MLEEAAKVDSGSSISMEILRKLTPPGGQIDVSFLNVGGIAPKVKAGQIRPLL